MKLCCAVAVAVIVLALCCQGQSTAVTPDECCFSFYNKPVPVSRIKAYQETHAGCPQKAVVLTTVADKKMCVNQDFKQLQEIKDKLDDPFGTQTQASSR
ncbi:hypothetical protein ACEWY4_022142 [Coilia grayii]|uniref:Chemokine interleukin-8-like domain-containing protein n=1 Tax=Coilia grayii TaxID=363190 RepID=A0ABD1J572_9TELE